MNVRIYPFKRRFFNKKNMHELQPQMALLEMTNTTTDNKWPIRDEGGQWQIFIDFYRTNSRTSRRSRKNDTSKSIGFGQLTVTEQLKKTFFDEQPIPTKRHTQMLSYVNVVHTATECAVLFTERDVIVVYIFAIGEVAAAAPVP